MISQDSMKIPLVSQDSMKLPILAQSTLTKQIPQDSKQYRQTLKAQIAQELDIIVSEMKQNDIPSCKIGQHSNACLSLCLSSSNACLYSASSERSLSLYNTQNKKLTSFLSLKKNHRCLCLSKNGKLLFVALNRVISVFSCENNNFLYDLIGHEKVVTCMVMGKEDMFLITGSEDCTVIIWNLAEKKIETLLKGHEKGISCLTLSKDNKFVVTGGDDKKVFVWNRAKYTTEFEVNFKCKIFSLVGISKNLAAVGLEDGKITIWNLVERKEEFKFLGHSLYITHLQVSDDGFVLVSSSGDSTIRFWNLHLKRCEFTLKTKDVVKRIAIDRDMKTLYTGSNKGEILEWVIEDPIGQGLCPHSEVSYCVAVADKYVISTSERNKINVWHNDSRKLGFCLEGHNDLIYSIDCSDDGKYLASTGSDKVIKIWDLDSQRFLFELEGHTQQVLCVRFSKNQKFLVSSARDKSIILWDFSSRSKVFQIEGHNDLVHCVIFISEDTLLASASFDCTIKLWNVSNQTLVYSFEGHSQYIMDLAHTDNYLISVSGDKSVKVWDLTLKKEAFSLEGHEEPIWSVCVSPNNEEIATASVDSTIRIWSLLERREKFKLIGHLGCVTNCRFSKDGKTLVSTSFDETIRVWNIGETDELLNPFPFQSKKNFMSMLSYFREGKSPLSSHKDLLISKSRYCLMHIFAHLGKNELLKDLLDLQPLFFTDKFGNSAFFYAIKKKSMACTELLLMYLLGIKKKSPKKLELSLQAVKNEFEMIIKISSKLLPSFIDSLLIPQHRTFGVPKGNLPLFYISNKQDPPLQEFMTTPEGFDKSIYLKVKSSIISFPFTAGSDPSIKFLGRLLGNDKSFIFRTELIRGLIKVKWNQMWYLILFSAFLLWINLILMVLLVTSEEKNFYILIAYGSVNSILLIFQLIQLIRKGFNLFITNIWNPLEVVRISIVASWIVLLYFYQLEYKELVWVMILFNFVRGFTGFRAFHFTRYYTRLVFSALYDITSFIFIFSYAIIACGVLLTFDDYNDSMFRFWISSYDLSLGLFNADKEDPVKYISFILASIFNMVIMLSLLISILSDSFDKFQTESVDIDYKEMAQEIINMEFLLFFRRKKSEKMHLHICDTKHLFDDGKDWEGKVRMIEKHTVEALIGIKQTNSLVLEKIKDMTQEIKSNGAEMQARLNLSNLKLENLEKKMIGLAKDIKTNKKK